MSDSSSEDEVNEAFKESANCDYIHVLVNPQSEENSSTKSSQRSKPSDRNDEDKIVKENDFERFLAQRLAGRLDEQIKIVKRKPKEVGKEDSANGGIRLFSDSPVVSELASDEEPRKKRIALRETAVDYEGRAEAAAVTPDWVKDGENTAHWKDTKKPRVVTATVVKKHANGVMEYSLAV